MGDTAVWVQQNFSTAVQCTTTQHTPSPPPQKRQRRRKHQSSFFFVGASIMRMMRTLPTISSVAKESGRTLHTAVVTPFRKDRRPLNSPRRIAPLRFLNLTVMRCEYLRYGGARHFEEIGRDGTKHKRREYELGLGFFALLACSRVQNREKIVSTYMDVLTAVTRQVNTRIRLKNNTDPLPRAWTNYRLHQLPTTTFTYTFKAKHFAYQHVP